MWQRSAYAPNSVILNALQRVGLGVRNPNPARDLVFTLVNGASIHFCAGIAILQASMIALEIGLSLTTD